MNATIDVETCIGCALCTTDCPEVFEMKGEKAVVIADPVPADKEESCKTAAQNCPTTAIKCE
ncbi:MAG: ferredoxin [Elusimicrobia bacterium]|nr:ferredoxin [Elusimicrobiota bacterium]